MKIAFNKFNIDKNRNKSVLYEIYYVQIKTSFLFLLD